MRNIGKYLCAAALVLALTGCANEKKEIITDTQPALSQTYNNVIEQINKTEKTSEILEEPETKIENETETNEIDESTKEVSLVMVGDVLLHTRVYESGLMEDGTYTYDHLFANVKNDIEAADLALVNQEVILGGRELGLSGYPAFNGAYEVGDSLVNTGFDVVLHATNHALDKGKRGLLNCIHFWKENYPQIGVIGIHESQEEADTVYITQVNGIRIAILNYTYGTNGISLPSDMPYAVELWNETKIKADVEKAKQEADFIVCCPHWGTEYVLEQTKDQEKKAQFLADLGVDLIIGAHPHVIEPIKWISGKDGNETLVYYSLGNFINATSGTGNGKAARMLGAMAKVTIAMDSSNEAYISDYGVEPLVTHLVSGRGLITTYKLSDYTKELADVNEMRAQDSSFSLSYCQALCRQVFGENYIE